MRRYHSKRAIKQAFCRILAEKPLEKITVRDIVEDCELTRNTFYYYYDDIYGIFEEILQANVDRFIKMGFNKDSDPLVMLEAAIDMLPDDPKLMKHICMSSKRSDVKIYFDKAVDRFLSYYMSIVADGYSISEHDRTIIFRFYNNAATGLLFDWLNNGMKNSVRDEFKRMGLIFCDSFVSAVKTAAENPEPEE